MTTMDVPTDQAVQEPHLILEPSTGWAALRLHEVWAYRDLLWTLVSRDVKLRYKQTVLGVAWVILQPLTTAGIFTFIFSVIAGLGTAGKNPMVFNFAGALVWGLFANVINRVSGCLLGNSGLISKVYFPRLVLPLSALPSAFLDFSVAALMLIALMILFPTMPTAALLLTPLWLIILLTMAIGAGLWMAALMVPYRDVGYILPVAMQLLNYLTPVGYPASEAINKVSTKWPHLAEWTWVYYANPLASILEGARWSIIGTDPPPPLWATAYSAVMAIVLLAGGMMVFKKMERRFADVI